MMVITSKMYLEEIHKECLKQKDKVDEVDLAIQKKVLENLSDWEPDDCMIDGYHYSAFLPYEHLIPSLHDYVRENTTKCEECTHVYKKPEMVNEKICKYCYNNVPV